MELVEKLEEIYELARQNKLVRNKGDFAKLIGMDSASLSHAFKNDGKVNLSNTITRAEHALMKNGISITAGGDVAGGNRQKNFDNISNPDVKEIVQTLIQEMAAQRMQLMQEMAAQRHDFMEIIKAK